MFVSRRRFNALNARLDEAVRRNGQILPMVMNASANLVPVFGRLESLGPDNTDTALLFHSVDGLANVTLYPANGKIVISDPRADSEHASPVVTSVVVQLDEHGELDEYELNEIRRFRADVLFTQQYGGQVNGPVSMVRRSSE